MADEKLSCEITDTKVNGKEIVMDVKVNLDTSDIITSMKAVQRISKNINKYLKENEEIYYQKHLSTLTNKELINELSYRFIYQDKKLYEELKSRFNINQFDQAKKVIEILAQHYED